MCHKRPCIRGALIKETESRLGTLENERLSDDMKINLKFYDGWLESFKKRWELQAFRLPGESGDLNDDSVSPELPLQQEKVREFSPRDVFNCDRIVCSGRWNRTGQLKLQHFWVGRNRIQGSPFWIAAIPMGQKNFLFCVQELRSMLDASKIRALRSWELITKTRKRNG